MENQSKNAYETIKIDRIIYSLNQKESTATIIRNELASGHILIPSSIIHKSQEYIVTIIGSYSFNNANQIESINFASDSKLQKIEKHAFICSSIKSITIPSSVVELGEEWCSCTPNLSKVTVMPNNPYFKSYNDTLILGKSNPENDDFDSLIFVINNSKFYQNHLL